MKATKLHLQPSVDNTDTVLFCKMCTLGLLATYVNSMYCCPNHICVVLVSLSRSLSLWLWMSVPDRQYEVKVWASNKQIEGAAAVWKGRTEKAPGRKIYLLHV